MRDSATIPHLAAVRGRAGALAWRSVETARDAGRRGDSQGSDTFALSTRMCEWTSDGQHYTNEGSPPPNRRAFIDAVDDTVAVGVAQCLGQAADDLHGLLQRQGASLWPRLQQGLQGGALHESGGDVVVWPLLPGVEDPHDVGMG